jgi:hypothetical protein
MILVRQAHHTKTGNDAIAAEDTAFLVQYLCNGAFCGDHVADLSFVIMASFAGRIKGGNMILRMCMLWGDIWFPLVFIRIKKKYEASHDKSKQYILLQTIFHISTLRYW